MESTHTSRPVTLEELEELPENEYLEIRCAQLFGWPWGSA